MKENIVDIWNLEKLIEKNIKKFNISNKNYKKINDRYIFNFEKIKLEISKEFLILNGKKYLYSKDIILKKEKKLFIEKFFINSYIIKENIEFIDIIVSEWKEKKTVLSEIKIPHMLETLKTELKNSYLNNLNFLLENLNKYKIKKDKYIYLIGRSLDLEERKIVESLKERFNSIVPLDREYNENLLSDLINFFYLNKIEYPKFSEIVSLYSDFLGYEKIYLGIIEFFENEKKAEKKSEKFFKKNNLISMEQLLKQKYFYTKTKDILETRERKNMSKGLRVEFLRDGNEHYYYQFLGQEDENLEYLEGLETEEQVKLVFKDEEELDFNDVISSYHDNYLESELKKKSAVFKNFKDKNTILEVKTGLTFPKVTYSDITEELVLGHLRIKKDRLQSSGLWAYQGDRWLEFSFEGLRSKLQKIDDISLDYNFKMFHYRNTAKEEIYDIAKDIVTNWEEKEVDTHDLKIQFPFNTNNNNFTEYLNGESFVAIDFYFELIIKDNNLDQKIILGVPVKIKFLNPEHKDYTSNEVATIDFGTSSTCIAINNCSARRELLSLEEPEERGKQAYENPTNLLIKDWTKFYNLWKNREVKTPIIQRYKNIDSDDKGLYNQGHSLKEQLKHASKAELNAQINQLKLIPYKLLTLNESIKLSPYIIPNMGIKEIDLVSDYEDQNNEKFDAIGFYSYLLGRAILSPLNGKIFKRFYITVPVKFEEDVKKSIVKSIKNGIRLAMPEPIKDKILVKEGNEEPVAFIGAICTHELMNKTKWGIGSKFAVFDFGGGTLDFSFGKYRNSNEDIDEELDYDRIIEVYNTAGDEKGGAEYIIHRLSYYLYEQNKEIMKEKRVPFVIPEGEKEIELFPRDLQSKTKPAILNTNVMNEEISRRIFEGRDEELEIQNILELQDENGNPQMIEIEVDIEYLKGHLRELIAKQVENFKKLLIESFRNEADIYDNLHIFRAGNASRSLILEEILEEKFSELLERENSEIHFIDEESVHGVKPKTAVSLGELKLRSSSGIGVVFNNKLEKQEIPFEFNVGYMAPDNDNEFLEIISIGSIEKDWKRLCRANKELMEFIIYYTKSIGIEDINNANMKIFRAEVEEKELENGNIVWVRPNVANKIEYIISRRKPEEDIEGKILELPRY